MATGIFYHPSFSRRSYMTVGNRLRDFPDILEQQKCLSLKLPFPVEREKYEGAGLALKTPIMLPPVITFMQPKKCFCINIEDRQISQRAR